MTPSKMQLDVLTAFGEQLEKASTVSDKVRISARMYDVLDRIKESVDEAVILYVKPV